MTDTPYPPATPPKETIDFATAFRFVFDDPAWLRKIAIGALMYLGCFVLIGIFPLMGYLAQLTRNVVAGSPRPLPEWDDIGGYFGEGVKLALAVFTYILPFVILLFIPIAFLAILGEKSDAAGGFFGCGVLLMMPLFLLLAIWLPAAMTFAMARNDVYQAFNFSEIASFIRKNGRNYTIAFVLHIVGNFISQAGLGVFCVGILFTGFWSALISSWGFAQAYKIGMTSGSR